MPFQFFLFFSKFFYFLFKKKVSFILLKQKSKPIPELLYRFFKDQPLSFFMNETKIVGNFLNKLNSFSLEGLSLLLHFFFLNCSKKNLLAVFRLNQFIKRTSSENISKGFYSVQKGKIAWKALSRKKKDTLTSGFTAKSNYNLASSESNYFFFSNTGVVSFTTILFFLTDLFFTK